MKLPKVIDAIGVFRVSQPFMLRPTTIKRLMYLKICYPELHEGTAAAALKIMEDDFYPSRLSPLIQSQKTFLVPQFSRSLSVMLEDISCYHCTDNSNLSKC